MVRGLCFLILLLFHAAINVSKASANAIQTVYCIGNHDATGSCWKAGHEGNEKLGCVITSWPIVECKSIPDNKNKREKYECLALQNTGITNQISLSCESPSSTPTKNTVDEKIDSTGQETPEYTSNPESERKSKTANPATLLEDEAFKPNAFQPGLDKTTFGVEQPQNFKDAF